MNKYAKTIRVEELTLKSLEGQVTKAERDELKMMLKQADNFKVYQDTVETVASLQDIDAITDRFESQLENPLRLRMVMRAAVAACVVIGLLAGLKILNRPAAPVKPVIIETIFSKTADFDQQTADLALEIRRTMPQQFLFINGGYRYKRIKSELESLKQTHVLGKENGDV